MKRYVWLWEGKVCARMPALILSPDGEEFQPMWRLDKSTIYSDPDEGDYVCIPAPRHKTIIRTGKGWGRRGSDRYYLYEPAGRVRRLVKRVVKKLREMTWMTCLEDGDKRFCFDLVDGKIKRAGIPVRF